MRPAEYAKKELVDVPTVLRRYGVIIRVGKFSCILPGHEDRNPSASVFDRGQRWRCHACGEGGDSIDAESILSGVPTAEVIRRFPTGFSTPACAPDPDVRIRPFVANLSAGTRKDHEHLARLRNLQPDGVKIAADRGLLKFGTLRGLDAWVLTDQSGRNVQARRLDGGRWDHIGGSKAWTLPMSKASWPIGCVEASSYSTIVLVEGGPDLLAACHFAWCEEKVDGFGPVSITGASNRIPDECLPCFAGRAVRIYPHTDQAGMNALGRWTAQLQRVTRDLTFFDLRGLRRHDSALVNDLNDLTSICPDLFDSEPGLREVLP